MAASIRIKQVLGLRSYLDDITEKVDKVDEHELISIASLIHMTEMSIRQDNMLMKLILK